MSHEEEIKKLETERNLHRKESRELKKENKMLQSLIKIMDKHLTKIENINHSK